MNKFIITIVLLFEISCCFSQITLLGVNKYDTWLNDIDTSIFQNMQLIYNKQTTLNEIHEVECFDKYPILNSYLTCQNHQLISKDGQMVAFFRLDKVLNKQDSIEINQVFKGSITNLNFMHEGVLKNMKKIFKSEGENSVSNNHLEYRLDLKQNNNADTILTYNIKLDSLSIFRDKFYFLLGLIIQKKDRGFVHVHYFLTQKGYANREKYLKYLTKMLIYK